MSDEKEIPADVLAAAIDARGNVRAVAYAILAERERATQAERERIAKRFEETYRNEEGEALRATFIEPETKDGYLQAWHQASDIADFIRYVA